jgi:hypothetical protein
MFQSRSVILALAFQDSILPLADGPFCKFVALQLQSIVPDHLSALPRDRLNLLFGTASLKQTALLRNPCGTRP